MPGRGSELLGAASVVLFSCACTALGFNRPVAVQHPTHTTSTGVFVEKLWTGKGPVAVHGSRVACHFVASLEDGTPIDSSYDRGLFLEFTLGAGEVIPGWEDALLGARQGDKLRISIPPERAFGERGVEGLVPPGSRIELVVELARVRGP